MVVLPETKGNGANIVLFYTVPLGFVWSVTGSGLWRHLAYEMRVLLPSCGHFIASR